MTVIDTSGVVDYLLGVGAAGQVGELIRAEGELAAPDVVVFEVIAAIRRMHLQRTLAEDRAAGAVADLGALPLELFPGMAMRERVWELRANFTAADAMFLTLAERLAEPLATKDRALARAISSDRSLEIEVLPL